MSIWKGFAISVYVLLNLTPSSAMDCDIIEYPDRTEVICDDRLHRKSGLRNQTTKTQAVGNIEVSQSILENGNNDGNNVVVSGIVALAESEDKEKRSIKLYISCNVETKELYDNLIVTIVGKNINGNEKISLPVLGNAPAGSTTLFTGSAQIPSQNYHDVRTWEVKNMVIGDIAYSVIARETNGYHEYFTYKAIKLETNPSVNDQGSTNFNAESGFILLRAKNGNVSLNHQQHQSWYGCSTCHGNSSGHIAGFGKDMAHTICKGCHATNSAGPTKCGGCHKK